MGVVLGGLEGVSGGFWGPRGLLGPSGPLGGRFGAPSWAQVGAKMGPKRGQKSIQKGIKNRRPKRRHLGSLKRRSWRHLGAQNGAKLAPHDGVKIGSNMETPFFKKPCFSFEKVPFLHLRGTILEANFDENSMENQCKNGCSIGMPFLIDFSSIWGRLGGQVGAKMGPKRGQKSIQKTIEKKKRF